jgi:3-mercaptopyruvate sulfurtransferase SseA
MCLTAYLSAAQARALGYPNTFVMAGGRKAWAEAGFPLVPENGADVLEPGHDDADGA